MTRCAIRAAALLFLAALLPPLAAEEQSFCSVLTRAVRAAESRNQFADITGEDAGLHHMTDLGLPGAKLCVSHPQSHPEASWECLMDHEGKYTLALPAFGKLVSEVRGCLDGWSSEEIQSERSLRETVFTRADSAARVQVLATKLVQPRGPWKGHRLLVAVYSPR